MSINEERGLIEPERNDKKIFECLDEEQQSNLLDDVFCADEDALSKMLDNETLYIVIRRVHKIWCVKKGILSSEDEYDINDLVNVFDRALRKTFAKAAQEELDNRMYDIDEEAEL